MNAKTIIDSIYNDTELNSLYERFDFTPVMQEWKNIKENMSEQYGKNTIILFQLGTFYEAYFHDAVILSRILGFTLTKKNKSKVDSAPMAGMPLSSNLEKLEKLLTLNFNIVIVSEINDNSKKTGISRNITKIITPSTNLDFLDKDNNYLLSVFVGINNVGLSLLDITTGSFKCAEIKNSEIEKLDLLYKYNIKEIIINKEPDSYIKDIFNNLGIVFYNILDNDINYSNYIGILEHQFGTFITETDLYNQEDAIIAAYNALNYAKTITNNELEYINDIEDISNINNMILDKNTIYNLEIINNYNNSKKNTLFNIINNTTTPFGSRLLKQNILQPYTNQSIIEQRLNSIEYLLENNDINNEIRNILHNFYDIEKLSAKLGNNSINPIDILNLSKSVNYINLLKNIDISNFYIKNIINKLNNYDNFIYKINNSIIENPNINIKEGNIFRSGYSKELDNEKDIFLNIETILMKIEDKLINETGIKNIKIVNNNLGFFIEIKNQDVGNIPQDWFFIKSLNNRIRYTNNEINELSGKYKLSEIRIKEIEYNLFQALRIDLSEYIPRIINDSKLLAELDILNTFTYNAGIYNYNKPEIINDKNIVIKNGRHPIIETLHNNSFVGNDFNLDDKNVKLITGPNMGGKSTYLKQISLIYILFQIGSYIPADKGSKLCILDSIFTRIGASDNLSEGLSTFGLEMKEMAYICNHYTDKSLVLIDEIGRGTDISNGIALAQSFLEFFAQNNKGLVLFSTHYSNIYNVSKIFNNIELLKAVVEFNDNNEIQFLHKIVPGYELDSYGIEVAKHYNIPKEILYRAEELKNTIV